MRSWLSAVVVLTVGVSVTGWVSSAVDSSHRHVEDQRIALEDLAEERAHALQTEIDATKEIVRSVGALHAAFDDVSSEQFRSFTEPLLAGHHAIQALSWNPLVDHENRPAFEARWGEVRERDSEGAMVLARHRPEYFPVLLIEPHEANAAAAGFDITSERLRRAALERARHSGEMSSTAPVRLVQETGTSWGVLLVEPVFGRADDGSSRILRGFAVGVIRVDDIAERFVARSAHGAGIQLIDSGRNGIVLYGGPLQRVANGEQPAPENQLPGHTVEIADREWLFLDTTVIPAHAASLSNTVWILGVLCSVSIAAYLSLLISRNRTVVNLVGERSRELERSNAQVRQAEKMAAIGTLAAGIAHELNNPLGLIRLAAESAIDELGACDKSPKRTEQYLREILEFVRRGGNIVSGVLAYARTNDFVRGSADLSACCERGVRFTKSLAQERGVRIRVVGDEGDYSLQGSADELDQLMVNIVQNAILASEAESAVVVCLCRSKDEYRIEVRDEGCGMSDDVIAQAFDPFFTTRRERGGTGLGLSTCLGIVRAHEGTMEIDSEPDVGTTIRIVFPIAAGII